ncbi:MAG: PEP-CTERM/exosortase system-associated acyltransferase [Gammaproteobacteria bacterium]|nr:PEP-CTERM/exosortase system-associated acyltransferase [Gammaproteobacteria bacterium]
MGSETQHVPRQEEDQAPLSLAENFHKYFRVRFANTKELRQAVFKIRHEVYCQELGWEAQKTDAMEVDEYDNYSYYCLLEHITTKTFAGCIRIVIPPVNDKTLKTPFEDHCLESIRLDVVDLSGYSRGSFGEISRLAVPDSFRRRRNEANQPFIVNEIDGDVGYVFTEEERRNFPNIAIGLYLAALKLLNSCHHDAAFVMMEPKLRRRLNRFGFSFEQAGDVIDYHGDRALFYLPADKFYADLNPELLELYHGISTTLDQQLKMIPYADPTDR